MSDAAEEAHDLLPEGSAACYARFRLRFAADGARPDTPAVLSAWALRHRERTGLAQPWDDALRTLLLERLEEFFDPTIRRRFTETDPALPIPVWTTTEIGGGPHGLEFSLGLLAVPQGGGTDTMPPAVGPVEEALRGRRAAALLGELRAAAQGCLETLSLAGVVTVTVNFDVRLSPPHETALVPLNTALPERSLGFYTPWSIAEPGGGPVPGEPVAARKRGLLERGFLPVFAATLLFGVCAYLAVFSVGALWRAMTSRVDFQVERRLREQREATPAVTPAPVVKPKPSPVTTPKPAVPAGAKSAAKPPVRTTSAPRYSRRARPRNRARRRRPSPRQPSTRPRSAAR